MEISAENSSIPKPPLAGVVYGEIAYWIAMLGITIALIGSTIYLFVGGYFNETSLFDCLWEGDTTDTIWSNCVGLGSAPHGFWYLHRLAQGDCLAMLGVSIACIAAAIGMWTVAFMMLRKKDNIFAIFSLIVAVILTMGIFGI